MNGRTAQSWSDSPADASAEPEVDDDGTNDVEENPWVRMGSRVRTAVVAIVVAYGGACAVGAFASPDQNSSTPWLVLSSLLYLFALILPVVLCDDERHGWFHPLVFVSLKTLVLSVSRRTPLFLHGLSEHAVMSDSPEQLTLLVAYENFLMALALLMTYAGFALVKRPALPRLRLHPANHLERAIIVSAVVSGAALLFLIGLSGSFSQHFLNLSLNVTAKVFEGDSSAYGTASVFVALLATSLSLALACRPEWVRNPFFWGWGLLAVALIFLATGKRSHVVTPLIVGSITWMLTAKCVPLFRLLLVGGGVFVLFAMLLVVRSASTNAGSLVEFWYRADFDLANAIEAQGTEFNYRAGAYNSVYPILSKVPDESPLLWGETYLTILLRPIPRAIMPNKPRGTDFRAGVEFFNASWGIPPGPIGEAYWNFHIPGVIAVFFLSGVFYRWLANLYLRHRDYAIATLFYVSILNLFSPTENVVTLLMHNLLLLVLLGFASGALRFPSASADRLAEA